MYHHVSLHFYDLLYGRMSMLAFGVSVEAEIQIEQLMTYVAQDQGQAGLLRMLILLSFLLLVQAVDRVCFYSFRSKTV